MTLDEAKQLLEQVEQTVAASKFDVAHALAEDGAIDVLRTLAYEAPYPDAHLLAAAGVRLLYIATGRAAR